MKSYNFDNAQYMLILEPGEDVLRSITAFVQEKGIRGGSLQGIGAVDLARLGQYDYERKDYRIVEFKGALEVVSLIGNVALKDGVPFVHAHMVVTTQDGKAFGGHLLEGSTCSLTMEVEIKDLGASLERKPDPRFNLNLLYDVE